MDPATRPRAVTVAGWLVIVCSVGVILVALTQVATIHSLATREALQSQLHDYGLHISAQRVLGVTRVLSTIAAACAAALAILAWYAMRGSRSSRTAEAVVAVPLFVAGLAGGAVLSTGACVGVALLFLEPARSWFGGTTTQRVARPPALVVGVVLTWVGCLVACVSVLAGVAFVLHDPHAVIDAASRQDPELARQDASITADAMRVTTVIFGSVFLVWCAVAVTMSALALRRLTWAWIVLLVQAGIAGASLLLVTLLSPAALVVLAPCALAFGALLNRSVRDWFSAPAGPPPGGWPPPR